MTEELPKPICARTTCTTEVHPHQLACRSDWFLLPSDLRSAIDRSYRNVVRREPQSHLRHRRLVVKAINHWKELDEQTP